MTAYDQGPLWPCDSVDEADDASETAARPEAATREGRADSPAEVLLEADPLEADLLEAGPAPAHVWTAIEAQLREEGLIR